MGCSSSKPKEQKAEAAAETDKTLLQPQQPPDAEKPAADPAKDEVVEGPAPTVHEEICKSCGGNGKDAMGKRCACPIGQAIKRAAVPLTVVIVSARGLRNADFVGKSDPYCMCEVSGTVDSSQFKDVLSTVTVNDGKPQDKPDPCFSTKVIDNSLTPEWNHEFDIRHYCAGDSLTFTVKDRDLLKVDDSLGQVTLAAAEFLQDGFNGEVQLSGVGVGSESFLKVKITVAHPTVTVGIISAKGLRNADWVGKSDPYCICEVPGRADAKIQTTPKTDELDPVWNFEAIMPDYRVEDSLTFIVKDRDPLGSLDSLADGFLGKLMLTFDQFLPDGFSGEMRLGDAGSGCEAVLTINVVVGEKEKIGEKLAEPVDTVEPIPFEAGGAGIVDDSIAARPVPEDVLDTKVAPTGLCC